MKKWYSAIILLVVALDRFVKLWTVKTLDLYETMPLWPGVFHFTYLQNTGAAFGMLEGQMALFYAITSIFVLALIWVLYFRPPKLMMCGVGLALMLAGALGNFYDRVVYSYVVDTFDFRLINFAVFNVADSAVCVGAGLFFLFYIIDDLKTSKKNKALAEGAAEAESEGKTADIEATEE